MALNAVKSSGGGAGGIKTLLVDLASENYNNWEYDGIRNCTLIGGPLFVKKITVKAMGAYYSYLKIYKTQSYTSQRVDITNGQVIEWNDDIYAIAGQARLELEL